MTIQSLVADIEGYAAIFHERDQNGDIIEPGAFRSAIGAPQKIKMLYQHETQKPIGRWTALREDFNGLFVTGEILLSTRQGRDAHALLSGSALDGLSIGFRTVKARKDSRARVRRITSAELWEISIVTFPMALRARVTRVGAPRPENENRARPLGARSPRRTPVPSPLAHTGVRQFATALRDAAQIFTR